MFHCARRRSCKRWTKRAPISPPPTRASPSWRAFGKKVTRATMMDLCVLVSRGGRRLAVRPVAAGEVVSQQLAAVLILVAVHAEVLPVAPVGRVVVVIAVLVVHGQEVQRVGIELARAFRTNPAV